MLVSHDYKFILVKTKKTAGSSIQEYLRPYCDERQKYPKGHATATEIRDMLGADVWDGYTKITMTRNPWDKMVSWYFWEGRKHSLLKKVKRLLNGENMYHAAYRLNFTDFITHLYELERLNLDDRIVKIDGKWPDYQFVRFDRMYEDMSRLCQQLGITYISDKMPKLKSGVRKISGYQQFYNETTKAMVGEVYVDQIEKFKYTFD